MPPKRLSNIFSGSAKRGSRARLKVRGLNRSICAHFSEHVQRYFTTPVNPLPIIHCAVFRCEQANTFMLSAVAS